jgi:cytochrome o ubiquinol oxidase subunit 3
MPEIPSQFHPEHHDDSKPVLLFWIYLMTDLIMFAALFAAYAALKDATFGGPSGKELFNLPFVLVQTLILLTSSFTCGLAMLGAHEASKNKVIVWLTATFLLGASFLSLELYEFHKLIAEGHGPQANAFLSSFFALLGTHGLHIAIGLLWLIILSIYLNKRGLTPNIIKKLKMFSLFWHFLDIVWIFIFTMVYLLAKV